MYYEIYEKINLEKLSKCIAEHPESKNVLEKFKELVKIDTRFLDEKDDIQYVNLCKILAEDTGWDGFFQIVLKSSLNELPELIKVHKTSLDEYSIKEIRKHHIFYLNKLIK